MRLPFRPLLLFVGLAGLSACQDPAGVGLGLIDEEGADPRVTVLAATSVDTALVDRTSIGFADSSAGLPQTRVLAGDVSDPVFGDARAVGYVDFIQPEIPGGTEPADVLAVRLEVQRTYVYGDTTTTLSLGLRQVQGTWSPTLDYPADTLLNVGPVLTTSAVSVADDVVSFDLPEAWVRANAAALIGDDFTGGVEDGGFEGFALEPTRTGGVGAVFGFQAQTPRTRLQVLTTTDTLSYRVGEVFSSVQRGAIASLPPGFSPAQVTSGRAVGLRFPLDTVGPLPLARAVLRAPVEVSLAREGAFVRPIARNALLYGIDEGTGERLLIAAVTVDSGVASTVPGSLTSALQDAVVGERRFERFELVPGAERLSAVGNEVLPASLDILPVRVGVTAPPDDPDGPRLSLTVIGS